MNISFKKDKSTVFTLIGIAIMLLLTATKIVPTTTVAGYSVFVGIAFFFVVEGVSKTKDADSGLRFKSIITDLKKPGVLLWTLLPMASAILTLVFGNLLFKEAFVSHVLGRTSSILSFDKIPMLIVQVVLAAWGEEIAFRGFFVGKGMKIIPFPICVLVSSIAFAAGHIAVGAFWLVFYDVATVFVDSVLYSMIYRKSGNCMISTLAHILCNSVGIAATFLFF